MNRGYFIILGGYVGWGLFPLYWALLNHVSSLEVLLHRIFWSLPVLLVLVWLSARRRDQVCIALRSWRELRWLALSSVVTSLNWGLYIRAVAHERVVVASMGYFLTPLLNVLAGVMVFRERLNRACKVAILCAAAGVVYYMLSTAVFPWVGIALGASFACYGVLRKQISTNAVPGLLIEVLLLLPFTLIAGAWLHSQTHAAFLNVGAGTDVLLMLGGLITVIPLALFTAGARMLPMTTVGILFYVTPSIQFLSGIFVLGEAFSLDKLIGFAGIWIGLAIFSGHLLRQE